jgi:hypothetical protein
LDLQLTFPDPDSTIFEYSEEEVVTLPLAYGDSWTSTSIDTFEVFPGFGTITINNTQSSVDGWGTLTLKAGEFDCLRLRDDDEVIEMTIIGGQVSFADTFSTINFSWIGKESILLAEIESMDDEDNPNFTQAQYIQVTSSLTGPNALVEDEQTILPGDLTLHANYPNPFNPSTTIRFDVPQAGNVELVIFDLNGRRIATLVEGTVAAGNHQISWNGLSASGAEVASGVYIYRLNHMGSVLSRKLTLLR